MVNLSVIAASIRRPVNSRRYGQTPQLPISMGTTTQALGMIRVALPANIPADAVITQATLRFYQHHPTTASRTAWLRLNKAAFAPGTVTWSTAPAEDAATQIAVTKPAGAAGRWWEFDVTAHVQAWLSGARRNYGWRLGVNNVSGSAWALVLRGGTAAVNPAQLVLDWLEPGDAPIQLTPDEQIVSIARPTLTFLASPDVDGIQVQIHTSLDFTSPLFDSGNIASTAGELDLAQTAFAGLAADTTYYWRARTDTGLGWSPWSGIAQMSRVPKSTLTITSPQETADDSTPPIMWQFSGTQVAWRVQVRDQQGTLLADSGRTAGTDTEWTPAKAVAREGASATITVSVWDAVDRAATPGDPTATTATRTYTLTGSASVAGPATFTVTQEPYSPRVRLRATRATAPDGWAIVRDGVRIYQIDEPLTSLTYDDWTARPGVEHTYRAAPIVNGQVSTQGPTARITTHVDGIWLLDPTTGDYAVLWGQEDNAWTSEEIAAVHQPIAGPPIRRVAFRAPLTGQVTGDLLDTGDRTTTLLADDSEAALWAFKASDASRTLRLVTPTTSLVVQVGNIVVWPTIDEHAGQQHRRASFDWWQVDELLWDK